MVDLKLTAYQQSALAELCRIMPHPYHDFKDGREPNLQDLGTKLIDTFQQFDEINWSELYDKLHRTGTNF